MLTCLQERCQAPGPVAVTVAPGHPGGSGPGAAKNAKMQKMQKKTRKPYVFLRFLSSGAKKQRKPLTPSQSFLQKKENRILSHVRIWLPY